MIGESEARFSPPRIKSAISQAREKFSLGWVRWRPEMTEKRQFCPRGHDTFLVGRDKSYRCLVCKRESADAARAARDAEAQAIRSAERERINAENERRREREYQRAIKAGGDVAAEARWQKLSVQTLEETESRWDLCQWALDSGVPGACTNRTANVYCAKHNRQLDREIERKRKAKEREFEHAVPNGITPSASRARRRPAKHNTSNWPAYKTRHPERARFYASSTWRSMRDRQLRDYPTSIVCGEKASHVDHVLAIANGGTTDGRLQSMCAKHHHDKTVRDSHEAAKRRREPR